MSSTEKDLCNTCTSYGFHYDLQKWAMHVNMTLQTFNVIIFILALRCLIYYWTYTTDSRGGWESGGEDSATVLGERLLFWYRFYSG